MLCSTLTIQPCHDVEALFVPHRNSMAEAYQGFFPADSPFPTDDVLRGEWRTAIAADQAVCFLATVDGEPAGTVATRFDAEFNEGEVRKLYVDPKFWGQGIGQTLLDTAVEHLRTQGYATAGLWVLEVNAPTRAYYERRGWRQLEGVTQAPYRSTEVRYRLPL